MCDSSIIFHGEDGTSDSDNEIRTMTGAKSFDEFFRFKGVVASGEFESKGQIPRSPIKGDITSR